MNDSIIKLEDCQLDEISGGVTVKQVAEYAIKGTCKILEGAIAGALGGVTGKQVAKYAIKGTCKILEGAIAGALVWCTLGIIGQRAGIDKGLFVKTLITFGGLGAIGAVGAMIADELSGILCKKLNLED